MPDTLIWSDTLYFEGDILLEVAKHFRGKGGRAKEDGTNTGIGRPRPSFLLLLCDRPRFTPV